MSFVVIGFIFLKQLIRIEIKKNPMSVRSVPISAAVYAYGRIHITPIKLDIFNRRGSIYYSDTDSIVTDMKLPDNMISNNEIGKLKLEHEVETAIFITGKTY